MPLVEKMLYAELPEYTVRVSTRAKRLQMRISPYGQIEVIAPKRFDQRRIPAFVAQHRSWLQARLRAVDAERRRRPELHTLTPDVVPLRAVGQRWQVRYEDLNRGRRLLENPHQLCLTLAKDAPDHLGVLGGWLQNQAKRQLVPWLSRVANEVGLAFTKVTVRNQKTRWGSCTSAGHISINRNLLFMPPETVRYLFIHELCHTVHLNHSRRYWALVARHAPGYREQEAVLERVAEFVPLWAAPA